MNVWFTDVAEFEMLLAGFRGAEAGPKKQQENFAVFEISIFTSVLDDK